MSVHLDFEANRFWVDEEEVIPSGTQYRLLKLFWRNKGRVLTTDTILDHMWVDLGLKSDAHMVSEVVRQLRRKFANRYLITTRRGIGYGMLE